MIRACERILETDWDEIDEGSVKAQLATIQETLTQLESGNNELKQLSRSILQADADLKAASYETRELIAKKAQRDQKCSELKEELALTESRLSRLDTHPERHGELLRLYTDHADKQPRKSDLESASKYLLGLFARKIADLGKKKVQAESNVVNQFRQYCSEWPAESSDLDATPHSAGEFFLKLEELERDGLPRFEHRFRDILENSTRQNLIILFREIDEERRDIKSRMKEVNESLSDAVFNRYAEGNSHLIIDVKDLRLPEFDDFKKEQNQIVAANTKNMSQTDAENYYRKLETLIKKIDGKEEPYVSWRTKVLDAREHVVFQGQDVNDREETLDIYDSGLGKSGGQRQKLTLTCLVAALRYQLGSRKGDLPSFAPIVMDDKADSEFTDISLKIFNDFGFQPIIATPLKGLLTLEPYMGSFAYVSCEARKYSTAMPIQLVKLKAMLRGQSDASENA